MGEFDELVFSRKVKQAFEEEEKDAHEILIGIITIIKELNLSYYVEKDIWDEVEEIETINSVKNKALEEIKIVLSTFNTRHTIKRSDKTKSIMLQDKIKDIISEKVKHIQKISIHSIDIEKKLRILVRKIMNLHHQLISRLANNEHMIKALERLIPNIDGSTLNAERYIERRLSATSENTWRIDKQVLSKSAVLFRLSQENKILFREFERKLKSKVVRMGAILKFMHRADENNITFSNNLTTLKNIILAAMKMVKKMENIAEITIKHDRARVQALEMRKEKSQSNRMIIASRR